MTTIWKFPISVARSMEASLSADARVLHVAMQGDQPCVWIQLNDDAPKERFAFKVFSTGVGISDGWNHCGTWLDGSFVWHLYWKPYAS
jgi:hypothetical protein